jgi:hypothetical protein
MVDWQARQSTHKLHQQVEHDREVQQEFDKKKHRHHRDWKKVFLWVGGGVLVLLLIFVLGYLPHRAQARKAAALAKQRQQEEPEIQVVKVKRSSAPAELTVPGTTSALTVAFLYARANGAAVRVPRWCISPDRAISRDQHSHPSRRFCISSLRTRARWQALPHPA